MEHKLRFPLAGGHPLPLARSMEICITHPQRGGEALFAARKFGLLVPKRSPAWHKQGACARGAFLFGPSEFRDKPQLSHVRNKFRARLDRTVIETVGVTRAAGSAPYTRARDTFPLTTA